MTRLLTSSLAALLAAAVLAPAAAAQQVVSVAVEPGVGVADCVRLFELGRRCGQLGRRAVVVSWSASSAGGELLSLEVRLRRMSGSSPAATDAVVAEIDGPESAGTRSVPVEPGQRLYAEARAEFADASPDQAPVEAAATSPVVPLPPVLLGYAIRENQICGFPGASLRRKLQARNWANLMFFPRFATDSNRFSPLLRPDDVARIRLHARGAGVAISRGPSGALLRRYGQAGLRITARRRGTVKIRATVDGLSTATGSVAVLPPRRACAGGPRD